jgi:hypothetical protein
MSWVGMECYPPFLYFKEAILSRDTLRSETSMSILRSNPFTACRSRV